MFEDVPDWPGNLLPQAPQSPFKSDKQQIKKVDEQLPKPILKRLSIEQFTVTQQGALADKREIFSNPRVLFETRYTRNQESENFRLG